MTSAKTIAANRSNARKSTGPRTIDGKARSRGNAWRHGLDAASLGQEGRAAEVEHLAKAICPDQADPFRFEQAVVIAESQLLLARVRAGWIAALQHENNNSQPGYVGSAPAAGQSEREAEPTNPAMPDTYDAAEWVRRALPGLLRLERYARRAYSVRRRAIRRFDALGE
jgi:hypothetical protein